jgi:hypothetical protein
MQPCIKERSFLGTGSSSIEILMLRKIINAQQALVQDEIDLIMPKNISSLYSTSGFTDIQSAIR